MVALLCRQTYCQGSQMLNVHGRRRFGLAVVCAHAGRTGGDSAFMNGITSTEQLKCTICGGSILGSATR